MGLTLHKVCPRGKAIFVFEMSIKIRVSLMSDFVSKIVRETHYLKCEKLVRTGHQFYGHNFGQRKSFFFSKLS